MPKLPVVIELVKKMLTPEFLRYIIVGVISAILEFVLFSVFETQMYFQYANVFAFILTNFVTYYLSQSYVFNSGSKANRRYERTLFIICLGGALILTYLLMGFFVKVLFVDKQIAKAIAIVITVAWNFLTRKHIVFRNRELAAEEPVVAEDPTSTTKF